MLIPYYRREETGLENNSYEIYPRILADPNQVSLNMKWLWKYLEHDTQGLWNELKAMGNSKRVCTVFSVSIYLSSSSWSSIRIKHFLLLFTDISKSLGEMYLPLFLGENLVSYHLLYFSYDTFSSPVRAQKSARDADICCVMCTLVAVHI